MENNNWTEYSKYVLLTLDKIILSIEKNQQEFFELKEKLINGLVKVKEQLRVEMGGLHNQERKNLKETINQIEEIVKAVGSRINTMDERFIEFKEKIIFPMKVELRMTSLIMGAIGGIVTGIIIPVIWKFFSKEG